MIGKAETAMQSGSLSRRLFSKDQRIKIAEKLGDLADLRNESVEDYAFEKWIDKFAECGYSFREVEEMIGMAAGLQKYGRELLAFGDVISNYERQRKETSYKLKHEEFIRMLRHYEMQNKTLLETLQQGYVHVDRHIELKDLADEKLTMQLIVDVDDKSRQYEIAMMILITSLEIGPVTARVREEEFGKVKEGLARDVNSLFPGNEAIAEIIRQVKYEEYGFQLQQRIRAIMTNNQTKGKEINNE